MSRLTFSIVVCTHNRSRYLADATTSLRAQEYPGGAYEIIVVDNASTDDTRQVVEQLQRAEGPPVRYVYELRLGFSNARNAGARAAQNEMIAFMDDDAVADPGWLAALAEVFEGDDQVVCVGGRIELLWDSPRPDWLPDELEGYLGCNRHLGDTKRELPPELYPFGGNLAVKRGALEAVGGFDPRFGRVGSHLRAHGETGLSDRLRTIGRIVYTPDALVWHRVLPERATREFLLRRGYWQGVADANLAHLRKPRSRLGLLRSAAVNAIFLGRDVLQVIGSRLGGHKKQAFGQLVFAASRLGRLLQILRLALQSG